jgi:hypothetical protein
VRRIVAFLFLVFLAFIVAAGTACSALDAVGPCPSSHDVADTVAVMGRNSHGVRDTLGLSITHKRVCE